MMLQNSRSECLERVEARTSPTGAAHEPETAAWPCHEPCPYEEGAGYHTCVLDANHDGRHFCNHKHAW